MGPTIKLSSGYEMPQVGFGLWKVENEKAADLIYNAIKVGYRLFDGAAAFTPPKWAMNEDIPARCSEELTP
ncbi:hypothetical protein NPX13_g5174 [Xylaria arbuscula]|uniref:NADP-dependent oxidoreductase domain-containing protein n=1 Tax=Xylaria arbuscula TaxID=114810 RepID=A0A9W8NEH0_9PEZI|nr:hypothetical protein NPX13_g5174 [Xylaria arbuscula]